MKLRSIERKIERKVPFFLAFTGLFSAGCASADEGSRPDEVSVIDEEADEGAAAANPTSPRLIVEGMTNSGPGCPSPSDIGVSWDPTSRSTMLRLPEMAVSSTSQSRTRRLHCKIDVQARLPDGWRFGIGRLIASGSAELPTGAKAVGVIKTYFANNPDVYAIRDTTTGPFDDSYEHQVRVLSSDVVLSACGGRTIFTIYANLQLDTQDSSRQAASISLDRVGYSIVWRRC